MFQELNEDQQIVPESAIYNSDTGTSKKYRYLFERYLFDRVDQGLIYLDAEKTVSSVNQAAEQLLGIPRNILIGRKLVDCWPAVIMEDGTQVPQDQHPALIALQTGKPLKDVILGFFNAEKQCHIWVAVTAIPETRSLDQQIYRVLITLTDVTHQKMAEARLNMASIIVNNIGEGIFVADKNNKIISINDAFSKLTGFTHEDVFGKSVLSLQTNKDSQKKSIEFPNDIDFTNSWQGAVWRHHKYGEDFPSWTTINEVRDAFGEVTHYIHVFMDITRLNKIHNHLSFLAYHDPLTKLPNRLLLKDRITHALQNAKREDSQLAVLFLDLDRFKNINDMYGHEVGDVMLREVAKRIKNNLRKEDTVSRYAGDEFIVVMEKIPDIKNPATLAQKLIDTFKSPIKINGDQLYVSASIGISLFPLDGCFTDSLLKKADAAMFRAKKRGRNNFQYFNQELTTEDLEMKPVGFAYN